MEPGSRDSSPNRLGSEADALLLLSRLESALPRPVTF
jgi:hypothetical protein